MILHSGLKLTKSYHPYILKCLVQRKWQQTWAGLTCFRNVALGTLALWECVWVTLSYSSSYWSRNRLCHGWPFMKFRTIGTVYWDPFYHWKNSCAGYQRPSHPESAASVQLRPYLRSCCFPFVPQICKSPASGEMYQIECVTGITSQWLSKEMLSYFFPASIWLHSSSVFCGTSPLCMGVYGRMPGKACESQIVSIPGMHLERELSQASMFCMVWALRLVGDS